MPSPTDAARMLRAALRANAAFSGVSGVVLLVADGLVGVLVGAIDTLGAIHLVGAGLLVFAVLLLALARRDAPPQPAVVAVIAADLLWVLGSWVAIGASTVTGQGAWVVGMVADVVLLLAIWQWLGLRRVQRTAAPA